MQRISLVNQTSI